jgi:hypothetical protein
MNERIKKLAEQVDNEFNSPYDRHKAIEKFAQLIVKECLKLNSKELSITAIDRLLPLYREHFGVDE